MFKHSYKLNPEGGGHLLAAAAFFLIFPTYICYQVLAITGRIDPVLGGYFTAAAVAALPLLLISIVRHRLPLTRSSGLILTLFGSFLILFALQILAGMQAGADDEITSSHWAYAFKFVILFLLARLLDGRMAGFQRTNTMALLGVATLVILEGSDGQFLQASILQGLYAGFLLDYQGMAYAYMVMLAYCASSLTTLWRLFVYLISFVALFLIGARSEFVGFILLLGAIEYCKAQSRALFVAAAFASLLTLAGLYLIFENDLADNRILAVLKLSSDQSFIERAELHDKAVDTILDKPLGGDYASYEPGHYAHSILSAWVDLGFLGFLLLLACVILPLLDLLSKFRNQSRDSFYVLVMSICMFNALMVFFAKNYTYQMIPIAIGLYCRWRALRHSPTKSATPFPAPQLAPQVGDCNYSHAQT